MTENAHRPPDAPSSANACGASFRVRLALTSVCPKTMALDELMSKFRVGYYLPGYSYPYRDDALLDSGAVTSAHQALFSSLLTRYASRNREYPHYLLRRTKATHVSRGSDRHECSSWTVLAVLGQMLHKSYYVRRAAPSYTVNSRPEHARIHLRGVSAYLPEVDRLHLVDGSLN